MKSRIALLCFFVTGSVFAEEPSFKFTVGSYGMRGGDVPDARGTDINMRVSSRFGNTWAGLYKQDATRQWRSGWDHSFAVGSVKLQPSIQAASGGFWGGSLSVETGETIHPNWYVGAGLGRTNLKPYVNLNFDPNDALMASGGYRFSARESLGLQWVRDNRVNIDQRNLHVVYRKAFSDHERLTLDVLTKTGTVQLASGSAEKINKLGLSVGYDWREYFVKVSYDPRVNFTTQNMLRLSTGIRF